MTKLVAVLLIALFLFLRTLASGRLKDRAGRPLPRDADRLDLDDGGPGDVGEQIADRATALGLPPLTRKPRADAVDPLAIKIAAERKAAVPRAEGHRRVKYLLDGDGRRRSGSDRVARIERTARGKGLCSPR
jgi:hypothetical protein